ncbi:MAG: corrinoid protein [Chloroflexi bacterium]|nr:corrinoid protein [Chloroflexota bacterium]
MTQAQEIYQAVLEGDLETTKEKVREALSSGMTASDILQNGLIAAMGEVGRLFEEGECFVPEMLVSARAMQAGLEILKPLLAQAGVEPVGKAVVGTVKGDLHDIGKNLVGMMLEGAGFKVVDLGVDVPAEKFVASLQEGADILGLSALLTTTMPSMEQTIKAIEAAGLRSQVKIIVGGAPVTAEYARQIGADGFAPDAGQAVTLAKSLIGKQTAAR